MYKLQMEEWALYNTVWVVNSLSSKLEQWNPWNNTVDLNEDKPMAGQVSWSRADQLQERFLYSLHVEYQISNIIFSYIIDSIYLGTPEVYTIYGYMM